MGGGCGQPDLGRLVGTQAEAYATELREKNRKHEEKGMSEGPIRRRPCSCPGLSEKRDRCPMGWPGDFKKRKMPSFPRLLGDFTLDKAMNCLFHSRQR